MAWADLVGRLVDRGFATFNETVSYLPEGGTAPFLVEGVFGEAEVLVDSDLQLSTTRPVLDLRVADLVGGPKARATVTIRDVRYRVESVNGPDDAGVARLVLMRASDP